MRTNIDQYGSLTLVPEGPEDRQLIYHLLNCNNLKEFSEYLHAHGHAGHPIHKMTSDLGVPYKRFAFLEELMRGDTDEKA